MPRKNHTHKYILRATGSYNVWACALQDCNHFMPPNLTSLVEGRNSYCWECDEKFIMDSDAMRESKPRCFDCRSGHTIIPLIELTNSEPVSVSNDEDTNARIRSFMKGI